MRNLRSMTEPATVRLVLLTWVATCVLAVAAVHKPVVALVPVAAAVGLGLVWVTRRFGVGFPIGLLVLGGVNALPGPDLSRSLKNSITYQDVVVVVLLILLVREARKPRYRHILASREFRLLCAWSGVFLAWYLYTLLHTWMTTDVPLSHAVTFSRQFLYFPLLLPAVVAPLTDPKLRRVAITVFAAGALVSSLAQIAAVVSGARLNLLLHIDYSQQTQNVTRIHGSVADLPFALLPFSAAILLYGRTAQLRWAGGIVALIALAANALGLTRAIYLGSAAGLVAALLIAFFTPGQTGSRGRWRLVTYLLVIAAISVPLVEYLPSVTGNSPLAAVGERATSLVNYLSTGHQDNAIETRALETESISYAIRGHWLTGIGELDPTYDYVGQGGVPDGNIDNNDVALLGTIAVIGIIGVVVELLPLLAIALALAATWWRRRTSDSLWPVAGGVAWSVAALAVTPTLGVAFFPADAVDAAFILGALTALVVGARVRHPA